MMEDKDIDQLFQENFADFQVTPPPALKERIDAAVGGKKNRFGGYFWVFTGAILLTAALSAFFFMPQTKTTKQQQLATTQSSDEPSKTNEASNQTIQTNTSTNSTVTKKTATSENHSEGAPDIQSQKEDETSVSSSTSAVSLAKAKSEKSSMKQASKEKLAHRKTTKQTKEKIGGKKKTGTLKTASTLASASKSTTKKHDEPPLESSISEQGTTTASKGEEALPPTTPTPNTEVVQSSTKTKADSTIAAAVKKDSTAQQSPAASPNNPLPEPPKGETPKLWLLQLNAGVNFGLKSNYKANDQESIARVSKPGLAMDLSFSRALNLGNFKYAGVQVGYGNYSNARTYKFYNEQLFTITDSVPIYDTANVIIGYNVTTTDSISVQSNQSEAKENIQQFSFGLQTQFDFGFNSKIGLSVRPGVRYTFASAKVNSALSEDYKSQRLQFSLGFDLYYDWKQWRFLVGVNSTYSMNLKQPATIYQERNRVYFAPQVGIGFRF